MRYLPKKWSLREIDCDAYVLAGFTTQTMHVVAPPGVRVQPEETDSWRLYWRHAVWIVRSDDVQPAIAADPPDDISTIPIAEVVSVLPEDLHEFIRCEMARQIQYATAFGAAPEGDCVRDRHAQLASRTCAWVTAELSSAFPDEQWFRVPTLVDIDIPWSAEELLRRLPGGEGRKAPPGGSALRSVPHLMWGRWRGSSELPERLEGEARAVRKRVRAMFWVVGLIDRLPFGDGAEDWLVTQVDRRTARLGKRPEFPARVR